MFPEERQQRIVARLTAQGRAGVGELADALGVSEDTVRRDLRSLSERGILHKTHGGALMLDPAHMSWQAREEFKPEAKAAIGALAATLVSPGQSLFLDAGSTVLQLAGNLVVRPLTVITNSIDIAGVFVGEPKVALSLTGGDWDCRHRHLTGSTALAALAQRRADWAFLGACAVHPHAGITSTSDRDAAVKRAMLEAADRTVVLADRTKWAQIEPHLVARLDAVHTIVTDDPAASDLAPASPPTVLVCQPDRL